ncbi:MAG: GerAB/ArcD/ProY family transporter [Christensenellales bacterium]
MTTKNKKISASQLCLILVGIFLAVRPIVENSLQAGLIGNDCIITSMVAGVVNLAFAMLICYVMNQNPGKSFYEIMSNFFGKMFTKTVLFLLAIPTFPPME